MKAYKPTFMHNETTDLSHRLRCRINSALSLKSQYTSTKCFLGSILEHNQMYINPDEQFISHKRAPSTGLVRRVVGAGESILCRSRRLSYCPGVQEMRQVRVCASNRSLHSAYLRMPSCPHSQLSWLWYVGSWNNGLLFPALSISLFYSEPL